MSWWAAFWCWEKQLLKEGFRGMKLENVVNPAVDGRMVVRDISLKCLYPDCFQAPMLAIVFRLVVVEMRMNCSILPSPDCRSLTSQSIVPRASSVSGSHRQKLRCFPSPLSMLPRRMSRVSFERTTARVFPRRFPEDRDASVPISAGVDLKRTFNLLIASFPYSCDREATVGKRTTEFGVVRGASDEDEGGFW